MKRNLIKLILLFFVSMLTVSAWGTPDEDYLCFTAEEAGATVELKKEGTPKAVTIQYSTDESANWTTVDFSSESTTGNITLANAGDKVYFRNAGTSSTFSEGPLVYYYFATTDKVSVSGKIMSLVDKDVRSTTIPCEYCFYDLFSGCTTLTSAVDLELPATTLAPFCYMYMFYNCTALKTAPELPSGKLEEGCYENMFYNCASLTDAPKLEAMTLAPYCYTNMFQDCSSLETAPALSATELAPNCYSSMFYGCTALETAPALSATELASYCYSCMFFGCTALETAPELPSEKLEEGCYATMFYKCASLTDAPKLEAMTLAPHCYDAMFMCCDRLTDAPKLEAMTLAPYCYANMFQGCSSLETAPALPATELENGCYQLMFKDCKSLTAAPELPATELAEQCYWQMFENCETLSYVNVGFTEWLEDEHQYYGATEDWLENAGTKTNNPTFESPLGLDTKIRDASHVPEGWKITKNGLSDYLCFTAEKAGATVELKKEGTPTAVTIQYFTDVGESWTKVDFSSVSTTGKITLANAGDKVYFRNAKKSENVSSFSQSTNSYYSFVSSDSVSVSGNIMSLVDSEVADTTVTIPCECCFYGLFSGCTTLTSAADLKLPATTLAKDCYVHMFYNCTALKAAPKLPSGKLEEGCYDAMFYNCASLTDAPKLEAMTLAYGCYSEMFCKCTTLKTAPELPATELAQSCYSEMFSGCTALETAPELSAVELALSCYNGMFYGCTALKTAPELPATELAPYCYSGMFNGCTTLETAPELPATELAENCYADMFSGCTALETAPELPSEKLEEGCYADMFCSCSSLTVAPKLEAMTLAYGCYSEMFNGCTALETAPELPATELAPYCYSGMFNGCSSLETAPELPATKLGNRCYQRMFKDCKSLTAAPELPATELAEGCYSEMFYKCTALKTAPELPATELKPECYKNMFHNCNNLNYVKVGFTKWNKEATENWLTSAGTEENKPTFECPPGLDTDVRDESHVPSGWTIKKNDYLCLTAEEAGATVELKKEGTPTAVTIQYSTDEGTNWTTVDFSSASTTGNITLANAGDKVYFRNADTSSTFSTKQTDYYYFSTEKKVSVSGNVMSLVDKNVECTTIPCDYCFNSLFTYCKTLTSAAELKLPATTLTDYCYADMFWYCTALETAPELPATELADYCYYGMFAECTALKATPELPATTLADLCYAEMFYDCITLTAVPELKAMTLEFACYGKMFYGCTALEAAPVLPATELAAQCYAGMFSGCKKLNYVNVGFAEWNKDATENWLEDAGTEADNPTFECPPGLDTDVRDASHVPSGWTIKKNDYLCFTAEETGAAVELRKYNTPAAVTIQYSTDEGVNWTTVDFSSESTTGNISLANAGDKVYFRNAGKSLTFSEAPSWNNFYYFVTTNKVSVSGNIMSLVDKNVISTTIPCSACFNGLFASCHTLTNAADLKLPATTLTECCYEYMFSDCISLESAPELPATELAKNCYNGMFQGCTALESAPELPAKELADSCYFLMFSGCKKLSYVKVGFTEWNEGKNATENWLNNDAGTEAANPIFESPLQLDIITIRDATHMPEGWTTKKQIDDAEQYELTTDIEDVIVTYKREFAETGKYEALYLPFSVTMTEELLAKVTIADIYMVSTKGSVVGGAQDAGVNVVVVKTLGVGESTKPHTPYFIRPKAGADLEFTQEHTTLYAATDAKPGHIACATTKDKYDFIGTYIGEKLTPQAGSLIYLMQDGSLKKQTTIVDLPCNRWKMVKTPTEWNDSYVAPVSLSKMLVVTLGEDDTTGIIGIDANADANLDDAVYNLQGQMLNTVNGYQGVVIRNGQKYLIEQ